MSQLSRNVTDFNPEEFLEQGESLQKIGVNGETLPPEPKFYMPAWARILWYNLYCAEHQKVMPLTTELIESTDTKVIVKATLSDTISSGEQTILVPIQTAFAQIDIDINEKFPIERAETRAKGRCLGAAGFSIRKETNTSFDEGDTPIDGDLFKRGCEHQEKRQTTPKKRGRPKKNVEEAPINSSNIPASQNDAKNGIMDEEEKHLKRCLEAFCPYGSFKGQQVIDVIHEQAFKEQIGKLAKIDYQGVMVDHLLSVNDLIHTLHSYLYQPTKIEQDRLLKVVSILKEEDEN